MSETARRLAYGHGSDVVRRLIARPIRLGTLQSPALIPAQDEPVAELIQDDAEVAAPATPDQTDRLKLEVTLMKAVLKAERRENENLRAAIGLAQAPGAFGTEARAVHERWAEIVDRLLQGRA